MSDDILQRLISEGLTIRIEKSIGDYIWEFIFFIFRCVFICLIPLFIILLLNFNSLDILNLIK